ncbi:hypothetical protein MMC29_002479 [Sticta canariensis]|nr:hypothetical protein [Sticta canariensis]
MSFGFSVGDIATAIVTVKDVYEAYKNSPKDYKDFSTVARQLCDVLEKARELCDNTHWSPGDKEKMNNYIQDLTDLSKDLRAIAKKYESLASGSGRTRDRIRWPPQEVINLRQSITNMNSLFSTFVSLVRLSPEGSNRENYEPSWASDQQTLTSSNLQDARDQPHNSKRSLFDKLDKLGSTGSSIYAGFGGSHFISQVKKPVEGGGVPSQAQRTLSAGEADQPKTRIPKKHALSFSAFGSSSPSLTEVRSPFGQRNCPEKPS